ncbi:FMN-linked oxidoreductase [Teratosphaeria destructans]|uniref:FMN-linked oxidoreductase n=1 Tax=Teratosphaeria destructans TaxID=418781 RepID=A0A9W7SX52_9PEZI|nr:FMN-linked oxidoreductase [Teratosphaeria destructans]
MPLPRLKVPLLNSANPWATTQNDLQELFDCPYTGAVTIRTSLLHGFEHDDTIHQYTFFDPQDHASKPEAADGSIPDTFSGSLNTLGYSPIPLSTYLATIPKIIQDSTLPDNDRHAKPFIVSVTGSAEAIKECYHRIQHLQSTLTNPLCMEINLSCPNIPDKPPPAYSRESLVEYLKALESVRSADQSVKVGIKTPPYTYDQQFQALINALLVVEPCPIDFITATNTLGSSLILSDPTGTPAIALLLEQVSVHEALKGIEIVGVGGVADRAGLERMRAVGAAVVGIGTALRRDGVAVFGRILGG